LRERWQFKAWNVLSAAEVIQPPQKQEDAEPGPKFDWRRLTELGLSLDVEAGNLLCETVGAIEKRGCW